MCVKFPTCLLNDTWSGPPSLETEFDVSKSNCTLSKYKGEKEDVCTENIMCDVSQDMKCVHYYLDVEGEKTLYKALCQDKKLCGTKTDPVDDVSYTLECSAVKNMLGMVASLMALYFVM